MMSAPTFGKLDKQVKKVIARVRQLERENEKLRQKAAKLAESLEKAPSAGAEDVWNEERAEVRQRVERLVGHLEGVLGE